MSTDSKTHHSDGTVPNETTNAPSDKSGSEPAAFAATINVGYMQRFLDAIRALVDTCRLELSPAGMKAHVVGEASATIATVELGTGAFESYSTDGDTGVIGISAKRLREIVTMTSNSSLMELSLSDTGQALRVQAGALDCVLELTDPATVRTTSGLGCSDEEYPSVVVLEGGELKRIVKAAGHVDSMIDLRVEWTSERFVAEADNGTDSFRAPREADDLVELFVGDEPVGATFNRSYLRTVKRTIHKRTEVTLALGTDQPLSLAFDIADGAGHVEYGIAPVVEAD
jgi:proliferating cell nuclear antigen